MNKQMTPAEIELVQQGLRGLARTNWRSEPIMGADGFLVATRPQTRTTATEPIVGDDGFLVGIQ
jgi:hypothetical protein